MSEGLGIRLALIKPLFWQLILFKFVSKLESILMVFLLLVAAHSLFP